MVRTFSICLAFLLVATCSLGCGEEKVAHDDPRNYPLHVVTGKIVDRDGNPLHYGGEIRFEPVLSTRYVSKSQLGLDGSFRLSTALKGKGVVDGAPAGEYSVTVIPAEPLNPRQTRVMSGKKYTVKPEDNDLTIELPKASDFAQTPKGLRPVDSQKNIE